MIATRLDNQFNTPHIAVAGIERTPRRRNGQVRIFSVDVGVGLGLSPDHSQCITLDLRQPDCRKGSVGRIMLAL